jgi:hypothetical protein
MTTDIENIIEILNVIKGTITPDSSVTWTHYNNPKEVIRELDNDIINLRKGSLETLEKLKTDFLPTCTFQELAITNGWGDYYLELADKFDGIYKRLKNNQPRGQS